MRTVIAISCLVLTGCVRQAPQIQQESNEVEAASNGATTTWRQPPTPDGCKAVRFLYDRQVGFAILCEDGRIFY